VWVIDRVHRYTAYVRLAAHVTNPSGFPVFDILVIRISYLTDRGSAFHLEDTHLA
jgi:hypothetical protein